MGVLIAWIQTCADEAGTWGSRRRGEKSQQWRQQSLMDVPRKKKFETALADRVPTCNIRLQ